MSIEEKLAELLANSDFFENNKNLANHDDIIKAIKMKVPEATEDEIDQYLTFISETMQEYNDELLEADLENVAGGFAVTITVAGVIAAVKYSAIAGAAIGTAIWYWKNRNR